MEILNFFPKILHFIFNMIILKTKNSSIFYECSKLNYSKTCLKQPLKKKTKTGLEDLQDELLTIITYPAKTCTCPLKAYAIKNIRE